MLHPIALEPDVHASIQSVIADGTWSDYQGWATERLERDLSKYFSQDHVQLCSSGTIATEIALRGMRVENGDEVILAAYDFPGNFRAIEAVDATPVWSTRCPILGSLILNQLQVLCHRKQKQ